MIYLGLYIYYITPWLLWIRFSDIRHSFHTQHTRGHRIQHASLRSSRRNIPACTAIPGHFANCHNRHDGQVHRIYRLEQRNAAEHFDWDNQRGKSNTIPLPSLHLTKVDLHRSNILHNHRNPLPG